MSEFVRLARKQYRKPRPKSTTYAANLLKTEALYKYFGRKGVTLPGRTATTVPTLVRLQLPFLCSWQQWCKRFKALQDDTNAGKVAVGTYAEVVAALEAANNAIHLTVASSSGSAKAVNAVTGDADNGDELWKTSIACEVSTDTTRNLKFLLINVAADTELTATIISEAISDARAVVTAEVDDDTDVTFNGYTPYLSDQDLYVVCYDDADTDNVLYQVKAVTTEYDSVTAAENLSSLDSISYAG